MVDSFAYLRTEDDDCFIALGDRRHEDGGIPALPVYSPDPDGDRVYDGIRLSKTPKDGSADLVGEYDDSGVRFGAVSIDPDSIVESVSPWEEGDAVYAELDPDAQQVYDAVREIDDGVRVIGSPVLGVGTDGSDLDLLWTGEYEDFRERRDAVMAAADLEPVTEDWLEDRVQDHAERYAVPEPVADYHHRSPRQRFRTDDGLKVGFSPSHVPGSGEDRWIPGPEDDGEPYDGHVEVLDDDGMDAWPRSAVVESEQYGRMELVTYHWAYGGSFEDGDRLQMEAEVFPEQDAVYIREEGQYAVPERMLED